MPAMQRMTRVTMVVGLLALVWAPGAAGQDGDAVSAMNWVGREAEIEAYLKTDEIVGLDDIPVGVTNPR